MLKRNADQVTERLERALLFAEQWLDSISTVSLGIHLQRRSMQIRRRLSRVRVQINRLTLRLKQETDVLELDSRPEELCDRAIASTSGTLPRNQDRLVERITTFQRMIDQALISISESCQSSTLRAALSNCRISLASIVRDQSHQRELESMRDVAEAASRAKTAFLAQMSHEIRTPITAIVGCAEQLQQKTAQPENRQLSRILVEQGEALMAILDDILDLSRIEADKVELEIRPTDILKVLRDLHRLMNPARKIWGSGFNSRYRENSHDPFQPIPSDCVR